LEKYVCSGFCNCVTGNIVLKPVVLKLQENKLYSWMTMTLTSLIQYAENTLKIGGCNDETEQTYFM
jgi:hypothetical protein